MAPKITISASPLASSRLGFSGSTKRALGRYVESPTPDLSSTTFQNLITSSGQIPISEALSNACFLLRMRFCGGLKHAKSSKNTFLERVL
ncbi:hypothetical protein LIER_43960 [Lithospermum erythrorhizon]|uniref:Uncharacterized protein n=1 Tax=Lithospermum erythrorhizon TaxID=34254 RepID=A0AAV3RDD8_LITER